MLHGWRPTPGEVTVAPVGRDEYLELLLRGGFPEAQTRIGLARRRFFDSYVASVVERDVVETSHVHEPASVETMLRLVAARSGSLARFDSLAREAAMSGLMQMRERIGSRLAAGVVLYAGEQTLPFGDRLWAVPLSTIWAESQAIGGNGSHG